MHKVCVLGLSEPMVTMILDNFESNSNFPELHIINNLKKKEFLPFKNDKFTLGIFEKFDSEILNYPWVLGVNKPENKKQIIDFFEDYKGAFINLINQTSFLSSTVSLGKGIVINSLVSVAAYSKIHDFVTINRNVSIGHHSSIGKLSTINPGANIAGFVEIGEKVLIGMGVNVLDHIKIGTNSIIGAGSVVTKDIPKNVIAYGNPCKIIRHNAS